MKDNKRWIYAGFSVVTLVFLGLIYAWSVFVAPLEEEFGWSRAETSLTFSLSMAFFCLGGLLSGVLSKRLRPRLLLLMSGGLVFVGFGLLTHANSLISLYVCYGVIAGLGVGIGYNSLMSIAMKWFPDRSGLISGILLMGFGFGGSILGSAFAASIGAIGWRSTFLVSGIMMLLIMGVAAAFLREAPITKDNTDSIHDFTHRQMLRDRRFCCFYLWAILLSGGGLALIGCAAPLSSSFIADPVLATTCAGLVSIANGGGRLAFGFVLDRVGLLKSIRSISFGFLAGSILLLLAMLSHSIAILLLSFCMVGFFYGAVTPTNSAFILRTFGSTHYSLNFSIVCTNLLFAAFLGPSVSGVLQNSGQYVTTTVYLIVLGLLSLPVLFAMYSKKEKRCR